MDFSISLKIKKILAKKQLKNFFNNMAFTKKNPWSLGVTKPLRTQMMSLVIAYRQIIYNYIKMGEQITFEW